MQLNLCFQTELNYFAGAFLMSLMTQTCFCSRSSGTQLVTSSGDCTVRLWDLSRRGCILTLRGHARAVRGCSWHSCGDFVASASADGTGKIWDVNRYGGSVLTH